MLAEDSLATAVALEPLLNLENRSTMGTIFAFIIILVTITTIGKIVSDWQSRMPPLDQRPQIGPGTLQELRESMDDLSNRLTLIEEERDFYKQLLDSPRRGTELPPPGSP